MIRRREPDSQTTATETTGSEPTTTDIFRQQAVEHHQSARGAMGQPLRISPSWTRWTYWLLVAVTVAGLAFVIFGRISEYAEGMSVIRAASRTDVSTVRGGTVTSLMVEPGERVEKGQVLLELDADAERAELARIEREFDLLLIERLRDPADRMVESALTRLRSEKVYARQQLDDRRIQAPRSGLVSDIWTQPGHHLLPGLPAVTLSGGDLHLEVIALFPGEYSPRLSEGQTMKMELSGYRHFDRELSVNAVSREVIGPTEAQRTLGATGDAVRINGPVVLVRASLPITTFVVDGETYTYRDGMQGRVEVRLRDEPILLALIPGLRGLKGEANE